MFTVAFYEIQTRGEGGLVTAPKSWHTFEMPADTPKRLNSGKDRVLYSFTPGCPVRIPSRAAFVLSFLGEAVLSWEYGGAVFPGGDGALPDETWVQLNPRADDFVIQLKLQKMGPDAEARDPGSGAPYVYGVTRLVVQVAVARALAAAMAPREGQASDTDRALLI